MDGFALRTVALALSILAVLVLAAMGIRRHVPLLRRLFLPNAVTAGFVALILGPQVLGNLTGDSGRFSAGLFGEEIVAVWRELPGLLINVVFAAILLGKTLPRPREIWRASAPQALFGATLSLGQYALGLLLAVAVLVPVFNLSELSGALLEISFTGGHGTAAGLSSTFSDLGFEEGTALALGLATVGLIAGILLGTLLINIAVRSTKVTVARQEEVTAEEDYEIGKIDQYDTPEALEPDPATSPLTITAGAIALAIGLGLLIQQTLIFISVLISDAPADETFVSEIPLFPFTILGGAALQIAISARGWSHAIPRHLVNQVSGVALDLLITAAIATLSLSAIGDNFVPFLLMAAVALAWSVGALVWLAPRFYGERWFERAIADFGQSSGTVASGFLLVDMADPEAISGAREGYGYKQLLFEPFLGGGMITALALPIVHSVGANWALVGATILCLLTILLGIRLQRRTAERTVVG
ncbi:MAG: sodium/glutamate symporter [Acidimicrobiia bacterium]|nr:sodium/glutamate symporter [Acidimicrobiia bacterium]